MEVMIPVERNLGEEGEEGGGYYYRKGVNLG